MLSFDQFFLYSLLCVLTPCLFYFYFTKRKNRKISIFVYIFILYIWQVYEVTEVGGLSNILYAPKGGINTGIFYGSVNFIPFASIGTTFFLNIVMTIPLGFLLAAIWTKYRSTISNIVFGICFSLLIEISQLITTRATDIDDLIANTFGCFIGFVVWKIISILLGDFIKPMKEERDAVMIVLLSFLGQFFLYYPFWFSQILN